jgi:hypothetical protein
LRGGGAETAVFLEIDPGRSATPSSGNKGPETITTLALQGNALVGKSIGTIESADAIRNHATSLSFKLLGRDDRLAGRILRFLVTLGRNQKQGPGQGFYGTFLSHLRTRFGLNERHRYGGAQ